MGGPVCGPIGRDEQGTCVHGPIDLNLGEVVNRRGERINGAEGPRKKKFYKKIKGETTREVSAASEKKKPKGAKKPLTPEKMPNSFLRNQGTFVKKFSFLKKPK